MISKSYAFIICVLVLSDCILEGLSQQTGTVRDRAAKKKGEINFEIGKYGLVNKGRFRSAGGPIGNIIGTGSSITLRKGKLSGLARLIDDRVIQIDRFGEPHSGMPEDMLGHIRFCAEFIFSGLFTLVFVIIRYPLKILTKAIIMTGAVGFILTYANWCINPISMLEFTRNGKKVNVHLERLSEFREEFKKRVIWITDKAQHADRQMYVCCSFHAYKRKVYSEVPEAISFAKFYHVGLYKLPEIVWCWKYQMGSKACTQVDLSPTDDEPDRTVAQSYYTHILELLDKFL